MKNKLNFLIAFTCLICVLMSGCVYKHIEDNNGESTELTTFTDQEIIDGKGGYLSTGSVSNSLGGHTSFSAKKLSGIRELVRRNVDCDRLVVTVDAELSGGNCRLVLVSDGVIVGDFALSGESSITVDSPEDTYILRIVGESASVVCEIDWAEE